MRLKKKEKMDNEELLPDWYWANKYYPNKTFGTELTKWIVIAILVMITFGLVLMIDTAHKTTKEKGQE